MGHTSTVTLSDHLVVELAQLIPTRAHHPRISFQDDNAITSLVLSCQLVRDSVPYTYLRSAYLLLLILTALLQLEIFLGESGLLKIPLSSERLVCGPLCSEMLYSLSRRDYLPR